MSNETVAVVFGGNSPEHDISILTGLQCERVLQRAGADVAAVYWDRGGEWHLVPPGTEARDYLDGAPAAATRLELRLGSEPGWYRRKGMRSAAPSESADWPLRGARRASATASSSSADADTSAGHR